MPDISPDTAAQIIATVVIGVIAVVGSIGGAILGAREGARASLAATKALSQEAEERQRASVRLLMRVEIDQNLANLGELRARLIAAATPESDDEDDVAEKPELSGDSYARAFARGVMPAWTRQAWESMTALLSPALDAKEIERVNHFYGQLETIDGIRDQLAVMLNEKPHTQHRVFAEPYTVQPTTFYRYGPGLAAEADRIMADLLDRGNPIAEA
jgi:hypothetical protein